MKEEKLWEQYIRECRETRSTTLDLSDCGISSWEEIKEIFDFDWLERLNLMDNPFTRQETVFIPAKGLSNLQSLDLSDTQITDAGLAFLNERDFPNLQSLYLRDTQITDSGLAFLNEKDFPNLQELNLRGTQITDSGLAFLSENDFPNLQSLDLSRTKITDSGLAFLSERDFPNLQSLYLRGTNITDSGLAFLSENDFPNLQDLDLSGTKITGSGLAFLSENDFPNLQSLDLGGTEITDSGLTFLSEKNFPNLQGLDLSSTQITDSGLTFLSEKDFPNLLSLFLGGTQITDSGLAFLSKKGFPNLQRLDLTGTQITSIKAVKNLVQLWGGQLEYLYLSRNKIELLPDELLPLYGNSLPILKTYFAEEEEKGAVQAREMKLIAVGNGMAGKTTLLRRFFNPNAPWEEIKVATHQRTHGIVISNKKVKGEEIWGSEKPPSQTLPPQEEGLMHEKSHPAGEGLQPLNLSVWDFGGQSIYHGAHRLFLSDNAVYLLVWSPKTLEDENEPRHNALYWMEYIRKSGTKSPVIVVQTHAEKHGAKENPRFVQLKERYGDQIKAFISLDSKDVNAGDGFNTLREKVYEAVRTMSHITNVEIPLSWQRVKDELSKKLENGQGSLTTEAYQNLCKKYLSTDSKGNFLYESAPDTLLNYLHQTGFLFYNSANFGGEIILDQEWVVDVVYNVLDPEYRKIGVGAVRHKSNLVNLWKREGSTLFTDSDFKTFINFMLSSGVAYCFDVDDRRWEEAENPRFIIPYLLPDQSEEPRLYWGKMHREGNVHIRFMPDFMHQGIMEHTLTKVGRLYKLPPRSRFVYYFGSEEYGGRTEVLMEYGEHSERSWIDVHLRGHAPGEVADDILRILKAFNQDEGLWPLGLSLDGEHYVSMEEYRDAQWTEAKYAKVLNTEKGDEHSRIEVVGLNKRFGSILEVFERREKERNEKTAHGSEERKAAPKRDLEQENREQDHRDSNVGLSVDKKLRFLVIRSTPRDLSYLKDSFKTIVDDFKDGLAEERLHPDYCDQEKPSKVLRKIRNFSPHILHIQAHGSSSKAKNETEQKYLDITKTKDGSGIYLIDQQQKGHVWPSKGIKEFFAEPEVNKQLELIVFNACHSFRAAELSSEFVRCAIGAKGKINDSAAIAFAESFYLSIGNGDLFYEAFNTAVKDVRASGFSEDAEKYYLFLNGKLYLGSGSQA